MMQIRKGIEEGIFERRDDPKWVCQAFAVPKADGRSRMVIDFRPINQRIPPDNYSLTQITALNDSLRGRGCYSLFDLNAGFWNLRLSKQATDCTRFYPRT
eukprot:GHVP01031925.1.p1 GENE.GHVP01031925.1~~GHVP01031925.1.p1  ORF type:complete len:100 (+),score=12.57 GHVP01031925.1:77-376(+)